VKGLVVVQVPKKSSKKELEAMGKVLSCLQRTSLQVLNLEPLLGQLKKSDPKLFRRFFTFHMTPVGNEWVAFQIADVLKKEENR
jgi:hypothetical protein